MLANEQWVPVDLSEYSDLWSQTTTLAKKMQIFKTVRWFPNEKLHKCIQTKSYQNECFSKVTLDQITGSFFKDSIYSVLNVHNKETKRIKLKVIICSLAQLRLTLNWNFSKKISFRRTKKDNCVYN